MIGDALLDVMARPAMAIRAGADVPAEIRIACGGQGANLSVRLARQGIGVELICGLGDDPAASLVTDALRAEAIQVVSAAPSRSRREPPGAPPFQRRVRICLSSTARRPSRWRRSTS